MDVKRFFGFLLLIGGLIGLDQWTKYLVRSSMFHGESWPVVPNLFHLTYVKNSGAAFGMLASSEGVSRLLLLQTLPVVACLWIIYLLWSVRKSSWLLGFAYAMIVAGAIGNLIDRLTLGFVVDFFDFFVGRHHFPAFNIADSAITVAAALLILDFLFEARKSSPIK